jgi:UDP-N-acetylmuramate--alanine ligase
VYLQDFETAVSYLKEILLPGDILLTLGAGDVWKVGEMVLDELSD